ncbi:uncharacterized protein Z518_11221 [Rhinocladiella mackenziei CBS 650.93]|uniref:Uncharacterized protein n=1 Tax=Rhinocladiella mackenziei CBS 650.93 TaxID=1442369 RepID=A0A0D2GM88_9EURO|nr:uncharacterized protein Z518_11221 [Rhinocladiella mackenziei CBS 650.93]KIW99482.1 hypothetical protein Z518_11221 [Rhinocladiella mackenziei CBS 650.93]
MDVYLSSYPDSPKQEIPQGSYVGFEFGIQLVHSLGGIHPFSIRRETHVDGQNLNGTSATSVLIFTLSSTASNSAQNKPIKPDILSSLRKQWLKLFALKTPISCSRVQSSNVTSPVRDVGGRKRCGYQNLDVKKYALMCRGESLDFTNQLNLVLGDLICGIPYPNNSSPNALLRPLELGTRPTPQFIQRTTSTSSSMSPIWAVFSSLNRSVGVIVCPEHRFVIGSFVRKVQAMEDFVS